MGGREVSREPRSGAFSFLDTQCPSGVLPRATHPHVLIYMYWKVRHMALGWFQGQICEDGENELYQPFQKIHD